MNTEEELLNITPEEFEKHVKSWLRRALQRVIKYDVKHRRTIEGSGGEYEIDILVELEVFGGALIKILIECKRYKNPIKRDIVMILESKLRDVGAHKGIIFSTSDFQSGAVKFAESHGIAVIKVEGNETKYFAKAQGAPQHPRTGFVGWFLTSNERDGITMELVDDTDDAYSRPLELWLQK